MFANSTATNPGDMAFLSPQRQAVAQKRGVARRVKYCFLLRKPCLAAEQQQNSAPGTCFGCLNPNSGVRTVLERSVLDFDRYQSGIDHSLIDLESGMVNWYLRIPLSSLILLSSSGAVFSRDPLHRTAPMLWKT